MTDYAGLAYHEIEFGSDGTLTSDGGLPGALTGVQDLYVMSHGWNNGVDSARSLYQDMFTLLGGMLGDQRSSSAAVGIIWPSLLFPEDDPATRAPVPQTGAQLASALAPAFPDQQQNVASLGALLDEQAQDPSRLNQFHTLASGLVTTPPLAPEDSGQQAAITGDTATVFGHAAAMSKTPTDNAQGLLNPFTALWSGAREVLRSLSYYEMKNRAGVIGQKGLGPFLSRLATQEPGLRIHLMGHSFGARLVSYALSGLPATATGASSPVKSLALIQGAFSHFAFADPTPCPAVPAGSLARYRDRVDGPLLCTFTAADRAVGWWYPAASALAHQNSESLTDLTYEWGGMGHDGFQQSPPATTLILAGTDTPYQFAVQQIYLLDANAIICADQSPVSGAHSDIRHPEVLWAIFRAAQVAHGVNP